MREKFRSSLGMQYFIYVLLSIVLLDNLSQVGAFGENNFITEVFEKIGFISTIGRDSIIFFIMFFSIDFFILKSSTEEIIIYEDDDIKNRIYQKLIVYKVLIVFSIILGTYATLISKNADIFFTSIYLIIDSILIYYTKSAYLKSYMYNRQLQWYQKINNEDIYKDTKKWRKKRKFNGYVKVDKKHRYMHTLEYIPTIIYTTFFFIPNILFLRIFMGYILLVNIASVIEGILSLYTSVSGICTSITEHRSKGSYRTYDIVVTDYENKTEMKFNIKEQFSISEMDRLEVVYGIFSKRCIMINNVSNTQKKSIKSTYLSLFVFVVIMISILGKFYIKDTNEYTNYNKVDTYEEKQKQENTITKLPLDGEYYDKVIDLSKEESFNDVTINLDKLYLGKENSKICFNITNNTDRGMVINVDYYAHIRGDDGQSSNILLPGKTYNIELDILQEYNKKVDKKFLLNLEYTLSETILNEYMDFTYYNHYPLNVIDNDCMIYINLETKEVEMNFNEYNEFYTKTNEVVKFLKE